MPDDRLFHKRLGHSKKVSGLSDLEFRVWTQYVLSADDFGVMRSSPLVPQADNSNLGKRPARAIQQALDTLVRIDLARSFEHQGTTFIYQRDWQDYQHVRYPKRTMLPRIPNNQLGGCTLATQWLWTVWPGGDRERKLGRLEPEDGWISPWAGSGTEVESADQSSGTVPEPCGNGSALHARADARNGSRLLAAGSMALANGVALAAQPRPVQPSDDPELSERAGRFIERYGELHEKYQNGAHYMGRIHVDFHEALQLVSAYDDGRLDAIATAFLNTDDEFSRTGTRTIAKLRSRASWCDQKLRARGL